MGEAKKFNEKMAEAYEMRKEFLSDYNAETLESLICLAISV